MQTSTGYSFKRTVLFCLLVCVALPIQLYADSVNGVRVWRAPDHTRVVFDLSHAAEHKIFELSNPSRLVIDIPSVDNRAKLNNLPLENTPIARIRSGQLSPVGTRFVLDLKEGISPRSFPLKKFAGKPDRLVIDLYPEATATAKTIKQVSRAANTSVQRDIVVVIDAGHGGEDPGAIGPGKTQEKKVVLDIAKRLKNKIDNVKGYKALLTRTGDYYIALSKRRDFARRNHADLFISIHADAFTSPKPRGASVFTLSNRGATSEMARFLARKENASDLIGGVGDVNLQDKDDVLASVLVDLSMSATRTSSIDVAGHVLTQMGGIAHLHKKHVEKAGFLVLKSPDVPSILVETGFISNPKEEKRLATKAYRDKMAAAILRGVRQYYEGNPPAGTYIAAKYQPSKNEAPVLANVSQPKAPVNETATPVATRLETYRVVRGDTLSHIADRYKMSLAEIKSVNKLKSNNIRIGQRLQVKVGVVPKNIVHRVASGDTLSGIALRYSTSINAIRRTNKLSSSSIRIGQNLLIPAG